MKKIEIKTYKARTDAGNYITLVDDSDEAILELQEKINEIVEEMNSRDK